MSWSNHLANFAKIVGILRLIHVIKILYNLFQIQTSQLRNLTTELTLLKQQVESQEEKHWSEITKMKAEHEQTVRYLQL